MVYQQDFIVKTSGRGTYDITADVNRLVRASEITTGLCQVFVHHTSASLILCENADPVVRSDLEAFMQRLVPDGDRIFQHTAEGPDDMPAHVRSILTHSNLGFPVAAGQGKLGIWQGIYLWEHRTMGHRRTVTVTIYGE